MSRLLDAAFERFPRLSGFILGWSLSPVIYALLRG